MSDASGARFFAWLDGVTAEAGKSPVGKILTAQGWTVLHSQSADVEQAAMRAFRKVLLDNGCGDAIKKFWTYID